MENIEKYYNKYIKVEPMPNFKELSNWQVKCISNSYGFALFDFRESVIKLADLIYLEIIKIFKHFL
jgi:hypothetical protein